MREALQLLGEAADPTAPVAVVETALADLRARWSQLDGDEQRALQPVAQLLATRLEQRRAPAEPVEPAEPDDEERAAYLAAMEAIEPPPEELDGFAGEDPAIADGVVAVADDPGPDQPGGDALTLFDAPAPVEPRGERPVATETPEQLLARFGLERFRPGQREAVVAALSGHDSLVVMPTGGGKSLCYQLPGIATSALTVIVSPLIALMRDQCRRLTELGHPAVMLAAGQQEENRAALNAIRDGRAKIAFAAPERFASAAFRSALAQRTIALFVVDEAHCVSEWGHDFRPDYLRLRPVIADLGHPPVMACTATATPKVAEEIITRLGLRDPARIQSGFDRPNLSFDVIPFDGEGSMMRKRAMLTAALQDPANRPAVVYCGTRKSTEDVADMLAGAGISVVPYHAGMSPQTRAEHQHRYMRGEVDVVVATNAFGMGVDKADVRSVWHWALPSSLESYYQEAGRAGRDGEPARAVLLASRADLGRLVRFIRDAEVTVDQVRALVTRLAARAEAGVVEIEGAMGDRDRVALAVAERAGALELAPGTGGRMRVELSDHPFDAGAATRMCRAATNRRWEAYRSIERYAGTPDTCRRRQILDHFGDASPVAPLGRCCDVCDPPDWLPEIKITRRRRSAAPPPDEEGREVTEAELAPLKAWRRERAQGKPAYTVANDATLREIVRRAPATEEELLAIKGIGPAFVERHSQSLFELLATTRS